MSCNECTIKIRSGTMITINNKPLHIEKEEGYTYLEAPVDKEKDTIIVLNYKT